MNRPIPRTYRFHKNDTTHDPEQVRPLTATERAAVQTFPPGYAFAGSRTGQEQQIGDSVPPLMAGAIARAVAEYEE